MVSFLLFLSKGAHMKILYKLNHSFFTALALWLDRLEKRLDELGGKLF